MGDVWRAQSSRSVMWISVMIGERGDPHGEAVGLV